MEENEFWGLIRLASEAAEDNSKSERLYQLLIKKSPDDIAGFFVLFRDRMSRSNRGDIWAAAKILNSGHCSDDCFEYFRCWLISNGQTIYESALSSADSLGNLELQLSEGVPIAQNESFCYVAADAYKHITGTNIFENSMIKKYTLNESESLDFDWHLYSSEVLKDQFPRLWEKYGKYFEHETDRATGNWAATESNAEVQVNGLGKISPGMTITHKIFGVGVIQDVLSGSLPAAVVRFGDGTRPIVLSEEYVLVVGKAK